MAQINNMNAERILNSLTKDFMTVNSSDDINLPQSTYARVRVRTLEQAHALMARGVTIYTTEQTVQYPGGAKMKKTLYWVLVPWEEVIRTAAR